MRVHLAAGGVYGYVDFAAGWPGTGGGSTSIATLAALAEAMAEVTCQCPSCPDVQPRAFLLALAREAPPDLAARLRDHAFRRE